jgi:hypothetical protein
MALTRPQSPRPDGITICDHLARSVAVVILGIEDGEFVSRYVRSRASDSCSQRRSVVELLAGCQAVICGGGSQGAANEIAANEIAAMGSSGGAGGPASIQEAATARRAAIVTDDEPRVL